MPDNAVSFTVTTDDGTDNTVSLVQDATTPTTIHGTFGGSTHDLTGCTASADGSRVSGAVQVLFFTDKVTIDVGSAGATIDIDDYGSLGGVISADAHNAIVAFVLACRLPAA
jgi:hypothetical protein